MTSSGTSAPQWSRYVLRPRAVELCGLQQWSEAIDATRRCVRVKQLWRVSPCLARFNHETHLAAHLRTPVKRFTLRSAHEIGRWCTSGVPESDYEKLSLN